MTTLDVASYPTLTDFMIPSECQLDGLGIFLRDLPSHQPVLLGLLARSLANPAQVMMEEVRPNG